MAQGNTLSLFVDESGILGEPATASRFYILGLVLHDQRFTIEPAAMELVRRLEEIGIKEIGHVEAGIIFKLHSLTKELVEKVSILASKNRGKILFGAGDNPYILLREKALKGEKLIESVNNVLKCLQNNEE